MKRLQPIAFALVLFSFLTGGNCSRARVESNAAMNEGVAMAQQRRYMEAITKLEEAGTIDPTNDQTFSNLAMVYMEMREFTKARDALQRAIVANGHVAMYHEKLGTVLLQLEEPDLQGAKAAFEHAIQTDPTLFKPYFKLAQVLERLGEDQAALAQYTAAVRHGTRFIPAYVELGRLYAQVGFPAQAIQVLRSGLDVAIPGSDEKARLHHMLGTVYQQQRNFDAAIEQFRAALQIAPGMPDALFSLGWTYGLVNNHEEAVRFLQKFLEAAGPNAPANFTAAARERVAQLGGQ